VNIPEIKTAAASANAQNYADYLVAEMNKIRKMTNAKIMSLYLSVALGGRCD
jgi:hypothetical protein